jgi:hypothetical protein
MAYAWDNIVENCDIAWDFQRMQVIVFGKFYQVVYKS